MRLTVKEREQYGRANHISRYSCLQNDAEKGAEMNAQQIDDDYIRDIQKGLEKILEELMKEE